MKSEERQLEVLKHIVDIFIETGEPASSLAVCERLQNSVSSATIRNDMAKLERLGYLQQPHTSAGRIPTYKGFRVYVESLIKLHYLTTSEKNEIKGLLEGDFASVGEIIENAALALADYTELAVVALDNVKKFFIISKVDVVEAGKRIYSVFIVAFSGEVKSKVCRLTFDVTKEQIDCFKKVINENLIGNTIDVLDDKLMECLATSLGCYVSGLLPFLKAIYDISDEISKNNVNFKGEKNLLKYDGLKASELIEFMSEKNKIKEILADAFSGINIFFGKENDRFVLGNSSFIVTKYGVKEDFGSFGVVGPIRLNYKKILPYVSFFSQTVTNMIEDLTEETKGGDGCEETTKKK